MKHLIVIAGPTASGKTALGIALARRFDTVILSADSRQFYREMNIGTAKPDAGELAAAPHHFINSLSIHDDYTVGDYERDAITLLENIYTEKDVALLVGGSGLFLRAVLEGLDVFPEVPNGIKEKYNRIYSREGLPELQRRLLHADTAYYEEVDLYNPHRLIRALAVWEASGRPFSSFRRKSSKKRPFQATTIKLDWARAELYQRINLRVERMMAAGQLEEARALYPLRHLNALQTVGYQELFDHFDGKCNLEEAVAAIQQNTRRYAKRQCTWLRKMEGSNFHPDNRKGIVEYLQGLIHTAV